MRADRVGAVVIGLAALARGAVGCGGDTAPVTRPIDLPAARDGVEADDAMPPPDQPPDEDRSVVADPGTDPGADARPGDGMDIQDDAGETVEPVPCHDDQDCVEALGAPPACHDRACHPERHECEVRVAADGFPCEDGDPCTLGDRCVEGEYVPGWYDVDEDYRNGCECQADQREAKGGGACEDAIPLGTLPDTGQRLTVGGNLVPAWDEDWFVVEAVDNTWDSEKDACDRFNLKVLFTKNPGGAFRVEVRRGGCDTPTCPEGVVFEWATNFSTNAAGECKCSLQVTTGCAGPPDFQACVQVTKDPFRCGACPGVATQGAHVCSDNGAKFFIRVRRAEGVPPSCDPYEIEISNGLYVFGG